ncbi:AtpZ/AtpI family protein [Maridesulfovibrio ferrireducens]|uniref:AtpZ/AtpI family protein n=1 Tax=Maridesulfovibrio ferrireducens TaxID=246191 RepID=UPI001A20759B|nr:AtpZ/AtpI family protein [Maridesulfovibrio ferrireducens]MBI9113113.1 AtpZ/AtpI family protein [Maridesulfovibrio ferrireducens]
MSPDQKKRSDDFKRNISTKEKRRIRAEKKGQVGTLSAFSSMGVVGWTVALPTVFGAFLGAWMDYMWPFKLSWTLTMLGVGLFTGCVFAGMWMNREKIKIIKEREGAGPKESETKESDKNDEQ